MLTNKAPQSDDGPVYERNQLSRGSVGSGAHVELATALADGIPSRYIYVTVGSRLLELTRQEAGMLRSLLNELNERTQL